LKSFSKTNSCVLQATVYTTG